MTKSSMRKLKLSKGDFILIGLALIGGLLQLVKLPYVGGIGTYLFLAAFIIETFRIYKKAKTEKKEVFYF